jgi:outer membrane receptor for ferrienterochelin and colicin
MELGQVTVTAKVNKDSNTELLRLQRNSATVVDGINAETFKKTPDSKASDVFKRITGASVQDNKFVIIRGLNDRYNVALLNGAPLPSHVG